MRKPGIIKILNERGDGVPAYQPPTVPPLVITGRLFPDVMASLQVTAGPVGLDQTGHGCYGQSGLEAQVMKDGMLVGFVPVIEGSEDYDEAQTIDAILRTDYDKPIATQRREAPRQQAAPLPREGGVFRRFLDGFREN